VFALYAFNVEVSRVSQRVREPLAGEVRLQWWRDALAGRAAGDTAGNPVASALLDTLARSPLPAAPLEELLDARQAELLGDPMPALAALEARMRATTSGLFDLVARLLGADEGADAAAEPGGIAYGLTELLRALAFHASRGRNVLPEDLLARYNAESEEILAGRSGPGLLAALSELRGHIRRRLAEAKERLEAAPPAIAPAFLPLTLVEPYLARMERPDYEPFRTPVEVPQWRRQWRLWRAARAGP
jgi:phytoene synthase